MNQRLIAISRVMGILLIGFSFTYLIPVVISSIYQDNEGIYFIATFLVVLMLGLC